LLLGYLLGHYFLFRQIDCALDGVYDLLGVNHQVRVVEVVPVVKDGLTVGLVPLLFLEILKHLPKFTHLLTHGDKLPAYPTSE